jgi:hypothetical protein
VSHRDDNLRALEGLIRCEPRCPRGDRYVDHRETRVPVARPNRVPAEAPGFELIDYGRIIDEQRRQHT